MHQGKRSSHSSGLRILLAAITAGTLSAPRLCQGTDADKGFLGVRVDIDCVLRINDRSVATVSPRDRQWIAVEPGIIEVEVRSSLMPAVHLTQTVEIQPAERVKLRFRLRRRAAEFRVSPARVDAIEVLPGGSFRDPGTGLEWTSTASPTDVSWDQAVAYCRDLSLGKGGSWRLPSREELEAVVSHDVEGSFRVLPHFALDAGEVGVQVWSSTDAAEILTPGDRRSPTGVAMVRDRQPAPLHQRMPAPPAPIVVPGLRAVTLDLASGKALSGAKEDPFNHRAFCVRRLPPAPTAEGP